MKTFLTTLFLLVFICITCVPFASGKDTLGTVTILYVLDRTQTIASNQIAVWVEDDGGNYIKSLFTTKFGAEGGFKKRPDTLPEWVEKSSWENATPEEVDAVSGAISQSGTISVIWDLTDRTGKPVSVGIYVYKIEGIISWKNRVVWQGRIDVGGGEGNQTRRSNFCCPG